MDIVKEFLGFLGYKSEEPSDNFPGAAPVRQRRMCRAVCWIQPAKSVLLAG